MKLKQISVFLENKTGQIKVPCKALAKAGINILAMSLADTEQFGILRFVVKDTEKAKKALTQVGCVVKETEVLAVEVSDQPGGLLKLLEIFEKARLPIEYMYAFNTGLAGRKAVLAFRFDDPDAAVSALQQSGINAIAQISLPE